MVEKVGETATKKGTSLFEITIERNGKLKVFVKTHPAWEDYLKSKCTVSQTHDLLGREAEGQFYKGHMHPRYTDDINEQLISGDQINHAILRCVGISEGLTFESDQLQSREQMQYLAQKMRDQFKEFFLEYVRPVKVTAVLYAEGI